MQYECDLHAERVDVGLEPGRLVILLACHRMHLLRLARLELGGELGDAALDALIRLGGIKVFGGDGEALAAYEGRELLLDEAHEF